MKEGGGVVLESSLLTHKLCVVVFKYQPQTINYPLWDAVVVVVGLLQVVARSGGYNDLKIFSHVKLIEVTLYVSLIDSVVLLNGGCCGAHGLQWASLFSLRLCMVSTHLNSLILPDNYSSSELKSKR